jgi:hypothetical protein
VSSNRKNGRTADGRFTTGNPGRTPGTRNKSLLALEALLDSEGEALTRKAIEVALTGDVTALNLCISRLIPVRRERPVKITLPQINNPSDLVEASAAIAGAVGNGDLTPSEGSAIASIVATVGRSIELHSLAARIEALEKAAK